MYKILIALFIISIVSTAHAVTDRRLQSVENDMALALRQALSNDTIDVTLQGIRLPAKATTVVLTELFINEEQQSVVGKVEADGTVMDIRGKYHTKTMAWVPAYTIDRGEVIREDDLVQQPVAERKLNGSIIRHKEDMIGMEARRKLKAGDVIRKSALAAPNIVEKGDIITLSVKTSYMSLTAQGRALQSGAKGDVVRVLNTTSNKIIEGEVDGERSVMIRAALPQYARN